MAKTSPRKPTNLRYTNRQKAKARRLYEYDGISQESIAEIIGCSRKSIEIWMDAAEKSDDPWVKGKYAQQLREKEEAAKVKAIEDAGFTKGMVIAELGLLGFSDIKDVTTVNPDGSVTVKRLDQIGKSSRAIRNIRQVKTTRTTKEGDTIERVSLDYGMHTKRDSLELIGRELGMFKTEIENTLNAPVFSYYKRQVEARRGKE